MNGSYKKFLPEDLYIPMIVDSHTASSVNTDTTNPRLKKSGNEILDMFTQQLHQYGIVDAVFHAKMLGLTYKDLCCYIRIVSGLNYSQFVDNFILLMANDLVNYRAKTKLQEISVRLGFKTYSGMYNFMIRKKAWKKRVRQRIRMEDLPPIQ